MCTAVTLKKNGFYFGRTLDIDKSYGESVVITPKNFDGFGVKVCYQIMGMATVYKGIPLFYDGVNEKGLCMAGLNFPGFTKYAKPSKKSGVINLAQYQFLPYILGNFSSVCEVKDTIKNINLTDTPLDGLTPSPLHYMVSDRFLDIVIECVDGKIKVYDNPVGVMTNSPTFDMQLFNLNNFMSLSTAQPQNNFAKDLPLKTYCFGMGAMGLPGDYSSQSRFVRATFVRNNYVVEEKSLLPLYHVLDSVFVPKGCCLSKSGYEITMYTSCIDVDNLLYTYKTYNNPQIRTVKFEKDIHDILTFPVTI